MTTVDAFAWEISQDKTDWFDVDSIDPDVTKWHNTQECNDSRCHDVSISGGWMRTRNNDLGNCWRGTQICPDAQVITMNAWAGTPNNAPSLRATTDVIVQLQDVTVNAPGYGDFNYRLLPGTNIWSFAVDVFIQVRLASPLGPVERDFRVIFRGDPSDPTTERTIASVIGYTYDPDEKFEIVVRVNQDLGNTHVTVFSSKWGRYVIDSQDTSWFNSNNVNVHAGYLFRHNLVTMTDFHCADEIVNRSNEICPVGGGGSVAHGTLITMADGTRVPVQEIRLGAQLLVYDIHTGLQSTANVNRVYVVSTDSLLTIHTNAGMPFRTDLNPNFRMHVLTSGAIVLKPVTDIQVGDLIFNFDEKAWVPVTRITTAVGGKHTMYDLIPEPRIDFIANGYADCPCKLSP